MNVATRLLSRTRRALRRFLRGRPTAAVKSQPKSTEMRQLVSFPGAQKAIDEYLGDKYRLIVSDKETGQYYLVKPE